RIRRDKFGLWNSSMGVPTVKTTTAARVILLASDENVNRPVPLTFFKSVWPPSSRYGIAPWAIVFNAVSLMSRINVLKPLSASTSASGNPTRPAPPTTQTSQLGAGFSFIITTRYDLRPPRSGSLLDSVHWKKPARPGSNSGGIYRRPRVRPQTVA